MKTPCVLACSLALTLCLAPLAHAQSGASVEERLARLEQALARLESRATAAESEAVTADELAPTIKEFSELSRQLGADGKTPVSVVKVAGKETKLSLGGFVQAHAEWGGTPDSRYTGIYDRVILRRARLTAKSTFKEDFEFTLQADYGNNSIGGTTGYRAQLCDAFIAWTKYPAAVIQLGQFKTPFGYEQLMSDTKNPTIERSLPNDLLTASRQIGLGAAGAFFEKRVSYSIGAFNSNGVNNGNNDNDQFMYVGRIAGTAWSQGTNKFTLGLNGYASRDTGTFTGNRTGSGADAQLAIGRFQLAGEYLRLLSNRLTGTDTTAEGWSVLGSVFIVPQKFEGVLRFENYDANIDVSGSISKSWVIGFNYYIKGDDLKLSLNYTRGDPAGAAPRDGRLASRVQVIF